MKIWKLTTIYSWILVKTFFVLAFLWRVLPVGDQMWQNIPKPTNTFQESHLWTVAHRWKTTWGPLWCKLCLRSSLWCTVVPPAAHQLKIKASSLMSTLWCLTEAELGQHWVSSFLRTALKQERIREEGNFAQKLLREEESGEVWSLHVQLSQLWIFSMDRITGHEIFWVERDPQGSSRHLGCCDFTQACEWWQLMGSRWRADFTPTKGRYSDTKEWQDFQDFKHE